MSNSFIFGRMAYKIFDTNQQLTHRILKNSINLWMYLRCCLVMYPSLSRSYPLKASKMSSSKHEGPV
jgi:hypothetical protein